ncbi:hypothetical protein C8R44DRAFT_730239 [Mycena epipterygia]|nr:hypothetical protein C8R44DRAFT_730239 [Mycena epipterygia]
MYVNQSESDEYVKDWESCRFGKRLTLLSGEKPDSPIQNRKHSVGSMKAEQGRLPLHREVNLVHKALPGTSGDEDEVRDIPHRTNAPESKARLKGKLKRPKNSAQEWSGDKWPIGIDIDNRAGTQQVELKYLIGAWIGISVIKRGREYVHAGVGGAEIWQRSSESI